MPEFGLIIDGRKGSADEWLDIRNPATGELVGQCPVATRARLDEAVAAASRAFKSWSMVPDQERVEAVQKIAGVIEANAGELAALLTREQGKPLKGMGSEFELGGCIAWTGATAALQLPVKVLDDSSQARVELHRKAIGVVGSITPWNWPLMIAIWHVIPAIRSGNTVVIKPSPYTPLSTLRLVELISEVLPAGVINAVAGKDELGQAMTEHPGIQKIVFTGSCATGRKVMGSAADTLKRLTLELGGNDAGIVLPDVDPPAVSEKIIGGAFLNNGQTCAALKRLYVHESIYDEMCAALAAAASQIPMGNGLDENNLQGPIQNKMQYDKVCSMVDEAVAMGGHALCGGSPTGGPGYFYPLTIIRDVSEGCRLVDEEQFGPALPVIKYSDIDDAIDRANRSVNGLGGSIWSGDLDKAAELAGRLECGTAWVNIHGDIRPDVPFGGVKQSGFGVEFGQEGLEEYTSVQVVNIAKGGV